MIATHESPSLTDTSDFAECFRAFRPSPQVRTLIWAIDNLVNDQGRPYDHAAYPHLGAPGGPFDAYDDPRVRTISKQWATRLGKTFAAHCYLLKQSITDPGPMMVALPVEKTAKEQVARLYQMCHQRDILNSHLLRNERLQKQDLIEFRNCLVHVAWSRSTTTLADKNIKYGHAGEYDKWEHQSTSREAHPHKLFDDRMKDYQSTRKVIYEGTPTVKGQSPIERRRLSGSNCKYYVPCPECKQYQTLETEQIRWDKGPDGKSDPNIAEKTARYQCKHCEFEAQDYHRSWMMRRGVWCPEGCKINNERALAYAEECMVEPENHEWSGWSNACWVDGKPARDGGDASYQLSSHYALSLGWGDIAKEFLQSKDKTHEFRNFKNQWEGVTWERHERKQTWEELGGRLITSTKRGIVPVGMSLITIGVDKQGEFYVYDVEAWGPMQSSHTVAYGYADSAKELLEVLNSKWACDNNEFLRASMVLIDSGFRPREVHEFIESSKDIGIPMRACRGASGALNAYYVKKKNGPKTSNPGKTVIWVDADMTQEWVEDQVYTLKQGDPGASSLYAGSLEEHQDYL